MDGVGYRSPPAATRFSKGRSGNPKGRPRGRRKTLPYEAVLGQRVTIREDGRERRVTAAEAFLLHLTQKGLGGDGPAARASLEALEAARAVHRPSDDQVPHIVLKTSGLSGVLENLGIAVKLDRGSYERVRLRLKPWIVQAALRRLGDQPLTPEEQREVWGATLTPSKVEWPPWWTERRPVQDKMITRTYPSDLDL